MFCPICKAECREGFTRCSDCDVDLVSNPSSEERASDADVPRNSEGLELLWSGLSQALSDRIRDALDAANISHEITEKDFGLLPNLSQSVKFVWIESRDRASSRSVLENALVGSEATDREADLTPPDIGRMNPFGLGRKINSSPYTNDAPFESVSLFESDAPGETVPDDIVEDFDPDDATVEVWSGDDQEMAEYLKLCLSGVGIGCVLREGDGSQRAMVLPSDESRAKEIVREIIEDTPPN
jgi:hypothetical protein